MRTLGLIGGLGYEAGMYYYGQLVRACEERGQTLRMLLVHAEIRKAMGHVAAGERDELAAYLRALVAQLAAGGAEIAAIPAVTPHLVIDAVAQDSPVPLVSMLEALSTDLQQRGMRRVALFGTRFVIESDLYGALPAAIEAVRPRPEEIDRIDSLYRSYAMSGQGGAAEREAFTAIARELCARERLDAVVLAGADLSALFDGYEAPFPNVDASQVHIAAILDRL